jgi:hypothetical protein
MRREARSTLRITTRDAAHVHDGIECHTMRA